MGVETKQTTQFTRINKIVDEYIVKKLLPRKVLAMNLDNNDEILKRRLAQ